MNIIEEKYHWAALLPRRTRRTEFIILHHAGVSTCTAQEIHQWHLDKGWAGIGYNYFVRKDGVVHCGRPYDALGSHCLGFNSNSVGICAEGKYDTENMPDIQKKAIIVLCRELLVLYPAAKVVGHGDCVPTGCPGINYPLMEIQERSRDTVSISKKITIKIDDKVIEGYQGEGGLSLGPVRALAEALGATVGWDEATQTVIITPPNPYRIYAENQKLKLASNKIN